MGLFKKRAKETYDYGVFIITKLVDSGQPVKFCWRQEPDEEIRTNGWSLFSGNENEQDMGDLVMVGVKRIEELAPGFKEIYSAPVGSEIGFLYDDEGNHIGYYDMAK